MARPTLKIDILPSEQRELRALLKSGVQSVRVVLRAVTLLQLAEGLSASQISRVVTLTPQTIRKIRHRYLDLGVKAAIFERPRPGAAELLTLPEKTRILAMVRADPPAGYSRWTVRLATEQAVKRQLVQRVGRETIRILLQSHSTKPRRSKTSRLSLTTR
jgi:putative transposase